MTTRGRGNAGAWARRRRAGRLPAPARACASALLLLAACSRNGPDRIAQVQQAADSADQLMIGLSANLTNDGVRTAYLQADSAFEYDNSGHTDLKNLRVTFFTPAGVQTSVLTADSGWYRMRTGEMEARGNVVVVRTDGARLLTSLLRFDQAKNQVSTDRPYTYVLGDRRIEGNGFTSDPSFSNLDTRSVRGTAGHFTLPGQ